MTFRGRDDVMAIPHVGGRRANFDFYDSELVRVIEIFSFHGAFEWFAREALTRGLQVGFIAGSDDHTCRPGIEYSMLSGNSTTGGLVATFAKELNRRSVWKSLWGRCCYGTTGARIILCVNVDGHGMGDDFTQSEPPGIKVKIHGTEKILEALLMRDMAVIYRYPFSSSSDDTQILIMWSGARSKGRGKRTDWTGEISLDKGRIISYKPFSFSKNGLETLTRISSRRLHWTSYTVGDSKGVLLRVDVPEDAVFTFQSVPKVFTFRLRDVSRDPFIVDAGGIDQMISVREDSPEQAPMDLEFEYIDYDITEGVNPYWVKVHQWDGKMAWSSPLFIHYKK
jgi:hypothetical protein